MSIGRAAASGEIWSCGSFFGGEMDMFCHSRDVLEWGGGVRLPEFENVHFLKKDIIKSYTYDYRPNLLKNKIYRIYFLISAVLKKCTFSE